MTTRRELLIRTASCIGTALIPSAIFVRPSIAIAGYQGNRHIAFAVERSGLSVNDGHRIVEFGAVELVDQLPTGRSFHAYLDPERDVCPGLQEHHGLSREFLNGKPKFADIAKNLLIFLANAELITRCGSGDTEFLDAELARILEPSVSSVFGKVSETFPMYRQMFSSLPSEQVRKGLRELHRICMCSSVQHATEKASLAATAYFAIRSGSEAVNVARGSWHCQCQHL